MVYSHVQERRKWICWFVHQAFAVQLPDVMEVYIDSTHRTNVNKAELFGIIAEENGTGIPVGYMLMENKPTVDSEEFPGEVTSCCTRFFQYAFENGLNPRMIHTDKSAAEINAIKVPAC